MSKYSNELKGKIIRAHLQEGRSQVSLERLTIKSQALKDKKHKIILKKEKA